MGVIGAVALIGVGDVREEDLDDLEVGAHRGLVERRGADGVDVEAEVEVDQDGDRLEVFVSAARTS